MSLHSGGQQDSLAVAELSSADLSGVSLNSFSPNMKQPDACPAGREVVFVCTHGPISLLVVLVFTLQ
jgi:hypothetical protein